MSETTIIDRTLLRARLRAKAWLTDKGTVIRIDDALDIFSAAQNESGKLSVIDATQLLPEIGKDDAPKMKRIRIGYNYWGILVEHINSKKIGSYVFTKDLAKFLSDSTDKNYNRADKVVSLYKNLLIKKGYLEKTAYGKSKVISRIPEIMSSSETSGRRSNKNE